MIAAVLHEPTGTPRAEPFAEPVLADGEVRARVLAAGLHPLVRVHAAGSHYSSHGHYPLVPGVDAVVELPDGRRGYVAWPRAPHGTFAEHVAVAPAQLAPLPAGLAPEIGAAIVNPAMSSWLALRVRAAMVAGERVLVLGATGAAGQLAVQTARALGAGAVLVAGRNAAALQSLAADARFRVDLPSYRPELAHALGEGGIDIVLDYLWGAPAEATLGAILDARKALGARRIRYVNIGESAGKHAQLSPHVVRSMRVELLGSGLGSVTPAEMAVEVPHLLAAAARGELKIAVAPVPLARVAEAWTMPADGKRVVIVP